MNPLLLASTGILLFPWLLLARVGRDDRPRPEVRGGLAVLWWINRAYCAAVHRLVVLNRAPLPDHGPAILAANHTSGVDNLLLQAGCRRVLGFMVGREFHENRWIGLLSRRLGCIPVNRNGRDLAATREGLRALKRGHVLAIFPEGRITPESGRSFGPGRPGTAFLALRADVPVIPAYIRGTPETNKILQGLTSRSRARLLFGPPIDLGDLRDDSGDREGDRHRLDAITDRLMAALRALRDESLGREAEL